MYGQTCNRLQERIMTRPFGKEAAYFKWTLLLVLCNRLVTCSFAALTLVVSTLTSGRHVASPNATCNYSLVFIGTKLNFSNVFLLL